MMKQTLKYFLLISIAALLAGCKLAVIVVEGGEVLSTGSGTCVAGTICIHQVNDTNYTETFTAVPNSGWAFVKWNSGGGFFCQNSTDPICVVSGEGAVGNAAIEAIIASDKAFYIMPIFTLPQPITDTVTVDGKEWAQADLFVNLSWDQINAVCPEGICTGTLNGHDMTGWTWASVSDINALFNHYIGSDELGPGPDFYADCGKWASAFFNDGWRGFDGYTDGWLRDRQSREVSSALILDIPNAECGMASDIVRTDGGTTQTHYKSEVRGGWFYRTP